MELAEINAAMRTHTPVIVTDLFGRTIVCGIIVAVTKRYLPHKDETVYQCSVLDKNGGTEIVSRPEDISIKEKG